MPDLEYSHKIHRQNLRKIWRSKEWKEANKIFHRLHPDNKCERCGRVGKIVPGHTSEDYLDIPPYTQKVRENRCEALCPTCNRKESKGKKPCVECIKKYSAGDKDHIVYIGQDQETCFDCRPQEIKDEWKRKHYAFDKLIRLSQDKDNANRRRIYREIKERKVIKQ